MNILVLGSLYVCMQQLFILTGAVTIDFPDYGFMENNIEMHCRNTTPVTAVDIFWYKNSSVIDTSISKYNVSRNFDGFNLIIFNLSIADGGNYSCKIDDSSSTVKTLNIYYPATKKDITIEDDRSTYTIKIKILSYPDPDYIITVTKDSTELPIVWNVTKNAETSGAIDVQFETSYSFQRDTYVVTVYVKNTKPSPIWVSKTIYFYHKEPLSFEYYLFSILIVPVLICCWCCLGKTKKERIIRQPNYDYAERLRKICC